MAVEGNLGTSANLRVGALLLLAAVVAFTGVDTLAKVLGDYGSVQVLWARYLFFVLPLLLLVRPARWRMALVTEKPWLQVGRAVLPVAASVAIVEGLIILPLADTTAILFAAPLMMTVLSIPLLGERVGVIRWLAVGIGFVGVVIVARPGAGIIGWAALWPLAGALFLALYQIATRMLASTADPMTTLFYTGLVGLVISSLAVPFFWTPPAAEVWALFVASGLLFGIAHFLVIKAFYFAEASALAPLNYLQVILAIVAGLLVFGEFPDAIALFGMVVVVGAGLFVFMRERQKRGS